jgi:dCTP deaminase
MILSDIGIKKALKKKEIFIKPYNKGNLQPASYDLTLGDEFLKFNKNKLHIIDPKISIKNNMQKIVIKKGNYFILHPGDFALGVLKEETGVNNRFVGRLEGKSSLARLGIFIHATAGFLDPGNCLKLTLEFFNASGIPVKLYPGMKIAQIAFEELNEPCEISYGDKRLNSKYFKTLSVKESKFYKNFKIYNG